MIGQTQESPLKESVRDFWQGQSCGEVYAHGDDSEQQFAAQAEKRYEYEPFIFDFAKFEEGHGKDVLEIGVGMGADHLCWAKSGPRSLTGVDLTQRAIDFTGRRIQEAGLASTLTQADAENLPFDDNSFDIVYSWGVLHHSPNTPHTLDEVHRVLRPGGRARIMIYHSRAIIGYVLWVRYALMAGRPWRNMTDIYAQHVESPGTKAYTVAQAAKLFDQFESAEISTALSIGDLMQGAAGQKHQGPLLNIAKRVWPRWFIKRALPNNGLFLMIDAVKSETDATSPAEHTDRQAGNRQAA